MHYTLLFLSPPQFLPDPDPDPNLFSPPRPPPDPDSNEIESTVPSFDSDPSCPSPATEGVPSVTEGASSAPEGVSSAPEGEQEISTLLEFSVLYTVPCV